MRAIPGAAALLLLAACSVPLEGGKCTTDQNCPSDQRCDAGTCVACVPDPACPAQDTSCADSTTLRECRTNSATCRYLVQETNCSPKTCVASVSSATCGCPPDGTTVGQGCASESIGDKRCDSNTANGNILACAADTTSGCKMWELDTSCAVQNKVCGTASGAAACECAANPGPDFFADSDSGSATDALPYATGVANPPDCRIKTLTQALAKAATYASGPPAATAAVRATGWSSGGGQKVFSTTKGETFPLEVKPGVTLATSEPSPAPGNYAIVLDDAAALAGVNLHEGGAVLGLIVQSTATTGDGVALACGASSPAPSITGVSVLGGGKLQNGIDVKGPCGALISNVVASGAASAALLVNSASSTVTTVVTRGSYGTSATGVKLIQGSVNLNDTEVAGNTSSSASGVGLQVGDASRDVILVATGLSVHDNDDTGIIVKATSTSSVSIAGATIELNKAKNPASQYGPAMGLRKAGGLLLWGQSPGSFTFQDNMVRSNNFDQVGIYESTGSWNLAGGIAVAACGVTSNTFTCRDAANGGYAVYSTGAAVSAGFNSWQNDPPGSQDVSANVTTVTSCGMSSVTCP